ncbi:MAG: hypothetical protein ACI8Z1_001240 [Candidatus Azotimanducaceae bacterium]|jgi:hypothetical protein
MVMVIYILFLTRIGEMEIGMCLRLRKRLAFVIFSLCSTDDPSHSRRRNGGLYFFFYYEISSTKKLNDTNLRQLKRITSHGN